MKITKEQLLEFMGLKAGDIIKFRGHIYKVLDLKEGVFLGRYELMMCDGSGRGMTLIPHLVGVHFEIVEDKIWDIDEIEELNEHFNYWFVGADMQILEYEFEETAWDNLVIRQGVAFKKQEYAEEYRKELLEFIRKYKEKAGL